MEMTAEKIEPTVEKHECCGCGWVVTDDEKLRVESPSLKKLGIKGCDLVCPNCKHDEFYRDV